LKRLTFIFRIVELNLSSLSYSKFGIYLLFLSPLYLVASPVDSNYIIQYKNDLIFRINTGTSNDNFKVTNTQNQTIDLRPNQDLNTGFGIAYRWLVFSLSFKTADLRDNSIYGKSNQTRFKILSFLPKHYFNLSYVHYKGMYIGNVLDIKPNWKQGDIYPNFPNLRVQELELSYDYLFNGTKFTLIPFYTGNQHLIKSCGSFILNGSLTLFQLSNDSSIAKVLTNPNDKQKIKQITTIAPTVNFGYGYGWALHKNFNLLGSISLGGGIDMQNYQNIQNQDFKEYKLTLQGETFIGLMYNRSRFFTSLTFNSKVKTHNLENTSFVINANSFNLNLGYRFKLRERPKWFGNKIGL
jgi:hypothetical protein